MITSRWKLAVATVVVGGLVTACGAGSQERVETERAPDPAFAHVLTALERVNVPTCQPAEAVGGDGFIALPAPSSEAAREHSWFRYEEGRIYEFGPCQLASGKRNELRVFRYADTMARDLALRDIARRGTRPTSTFAYRDVHALEIWSPEPSLETPVGQLAQKVHSSIGAMQEAWHLDLEPGAGA